MQTLKVNTITAGLKDAIGVDLESVTIKIQDQGPTVTAREWELLHFNPAGRIVTLRDGRGEVIVVGLEAMYWTGREVMPAPTRTPKNPKKPESPPKTTTEGGDDGANTDGDDGKKPAGKS